MIEKSNDSESFAPSKSEELNTVATSTSDTLLSLSAQAPVVLEPDVIVLEKFKIISLLGQGGMGSVYKVEHLLMGRQFALKCLNKFQSADGSWRRFQNEARAAHLLDHTNLLKVYEFGLLPGGQPFFLMELVEGVTLADEIKKYGQLPIERAVQIFIQVAFALSYAHESHVIHRDIKPSNIMVSSKGSDNQTETVKVVDFGIAKLTGVDEFNQQTLTKTGEIFGSPLYMSPEQCTGIAVDHRSDLYSLGCVFYETLTGAPPFLGESALSTMMKHQGEKPLSLKEASLGTQYPQVLENIVAKLLEKDPANRYQTANALAKDLIQLERRLSEESKGTLTQIKPAPAPKAPVREIKDKELVLNEQNIALLLSLAGIIFGLGAFTSYFVTSPQKQITAATYQVEETNSMLASGRKGDADKKELEARAIDPREQLERDDPQYMLAVEKSSRWSVVNDKVRNYAFPQKKSLGEIVLSGGDAHEARGSLKVPATELVGIVASEYLIRNPKLMDKFAPDELTLLDLNSIKVRNETFISKIGNQVGLKFLNLFSTPVQNNDLKLLSKLKNLRYLNVAWTNLSCKQILQVLHPETICSLDVSGIKDTQVIFKNFERFPKLQQLVLCSCDLSSKDMSALAKSKVRILCLGWNDAVKDPGIRDLTPLTSLERLDLSSTKVTSRCWESLQKFPRLHSVKLSNMRWLPADKLYFSKQMRLHCPQVLVDYQPANFKEFSNAVTDIDWLNKGADQHEYPISVMLKENLPFMHTDPK